jgi:hypothetical protein
LQSRAQSSILLSELFPFFLCSHADTLPDLSFCGNCMGLLNSYEFYTYPQLTSQAVQSWVQTLPPEEAQLAQPPLKIAQSLFWKSQKPLLFSFSLECIKGRLGGTINR